MFKFHWFVFPNITFPPITFPPIIVRDLINFSCPHFLISMEGCAVCSQREHAIYLACCNRILCTLCYEAWCGMVRSIDHACPLCGGELQTPPSRVATSTPPAPRRRVRNENALNDQAVRRRLDFPSLEEQQQSLNEQMFVVECALAEQVEKFEQGWFTSVFTKGYVQRRIDVLANTLNRLRMQAEELDKSMSFSD